MTTESRERVRSRQRDRERERKIARETLRHSDLVDERCLATFMANPLWFIFSCVRTKAITSDGIKSNAQSSQVRCPNFMDFYSKRKDLSTCKTLRRLMHSYIIKMIGCG